MGTGIQMQGAQGNLSDQAAAMTPSDRIHSQPRNVRKSKRSTGDWRAHLPLKPQSAARRRALVRHSFSTAMGPPEQPHPSEERGHELIAAAQPTPKPIKELNIRIFQSFKNQKTQKGRGFHHQDEAIHEPSIKNLWKSGLQ